VLADGDAIRPPASGLQIILFPMPNFTQFNQNGHRKMTFIISRCPINLNSRKIDIDNSIFKNPDASEPFGPV
jgi:hypothetical protein